MSKIIIYQKPTCTTCRQVYKILKESNVDFNAVDYYIHPLSKAKLRELLKKMNLTARDILRTKEPVFQELNIAHQQYTENELLDLMVKHPDLIQRPIVEKGARAILARPAEKIKDIL